MSLSKTFLIHFQRPQFPQRSGQLSAAECSDRMPPDPFWRQFLEWIQEIWPILFSASLCAAAHYLIHRPELHRPIRADDVCEDDGQNERPNPDLRPVIFDQVQRRFRRCTTNDLVVDGTSSSVADSGHVSLLESIESEASDSLANDVAYQVEVVENKDIEGEKKLN